MKIDKKKITRYEYNEILDLEADPYEKITHRLISRRFYTNSFKKRMEDRITLSIYQDCLKPFGTNINYFVYNRSDHSVKGILIKKVAGICQKG